MILSIERKSLLNLYRLLYLNEKEMLDEAMTINIEPIQIVVFKLKQKKQIVMSGTKLNLYRLLYLNGTAPTIS